jgi:hypothetical protein
MSREMVIEAKSNVFTYEALKQKDQKIADRFISPDFNPGALKRVRNKNNPKRKYEVMKDLYYEEGNKKVWLSLGDQITFSK